MIEVYKLTPNYSDPVVAVKLPLSAQVSTRGNR